MSTISNMATLSSEFDLDIEHLERLGVVDVMLAADSPLFIDPLLLECSSHEEMRVGAARSYRERFERLVKLLSLSQSEGDLPWRNARRLLKFSEINWTCLGYSSSARGSGFGADLTASTLKTASEIIQMGVTDADLFMALALFEEGIGPDRISDMTTNIILPDLIAFTQRVNRSLQLPDKRWKIGSETYVLPSNPYKNAPLLLVPRDIVRDLPIASCWSDISKVVNENNELRDRVNAHLGQIWATMGKREKRRLKRAALSSKQAFEQLLDMLNEVERKSYDFDNDRNGESSWIKYVGKIASKYPYDLSHYSARELDVDEAVEVVRRIILQFEDLVEKEGIWKDFWDDKGKPRKEKAAQRLFYVVARSYCEANDLDLSPEADSGNGPVDFKVSRGSKAKVVVEIKLSTNTSLVHGYEKQLEIYKAAERADKGIFLIIDVGGLGQKYATVQRLRSKALLAGASPSDIVYIDASQRASASKRVS